MQGNDLEADAQPLDVDSRFAGFDGRSFESELVPRYLSGRDLFVKIGYDWRP